MSDVVLTGQQRRSCLIALIASLAVMAITTGMTWPLLAEILRDQGVDESIIGLSAASQFIGTIIVSFLATRIIPRLGFFRATLTGMALVFVTILLIPAFRDVLVWFPLRFVFGIGNALLFLAGETWINRILDDHSRGRWIGVYSTVGMAGWALGPVIAGTVDGSGWTPFLIAAACIVPATLLLLPTRSINLDTRTKQADEATGSTMWLAFVAAPTVLLSAAMFGFIDGALLSFGHLYTMDMLGSEHRDIAYAVIWTGLIGAVVWQMPLGWLADRVDRGWMLVGCVATIAVACALLPLVIDGGLAPWYSLQGLALWVTLIVWGAAMGGTFTVGMTLLGQRFTGQALIAANAVFSLFFAVGGLTGPFSVGSAMSAWGPEAFPATLLGVAVAYCAFAAYRQATRRRRLATGSM
ncbi:MAG: MFS transporter [Pseudomonadota bacterium]